MSRMAKQTNGADAYIAQLFNGTGNQDCDFFPLGVKVGQANRTEHQAARLPKIKPWPTRAPKWLVLKL